MNADTFTKHAVSGEIPLPVMTIIAFLLLMLPYLIYRYTGKSVTEWLRLSVLIDGINRLGERRKGRREGSRGAAEKQKDSETGKRQPKKHKKPSPAEGASEGARVCMQTDYLGFISDILRFARKNRLFAVVPGDICYGGQTAHLTALLITRARIIAIMAYAFDGPIKPDGTGKWLVGGSDEDAGDLTQEASQQDVLAKGTIRQMGMNPALCDTVIVFTGRNADLPKSRPANAMTAKEFFGSYLKEDDLMGNILDPVDTGKRLNLLRSSGKYGKHRK